MTDKITELADAIGAFVVGPDAAFVDKGFDMDRVLILGGPGVQIGVMRGEPEPCRCGEPAGPGHCDRCHNDPPRGHACPRCGIASPAEESPHGH